MSPRDQKGSANDNQNPEWINGHRKTGKIKLIIYLILAAFILGSVVTSVVTFLLLKPDLLLNNPTPLPTPSPSPSATLSPTPSSVQPSSTPTESLNSSPQPTNSPQTDVPAITNQGELKNSELPGYFPQQGFKAPPSDLSRFKKRDSLLESMVISGDRYITFLKGKILVRGQLYSPVFSLRGDTNEQRVGFELNGSQKALLLQFGLQDLTAGDTNLTYLVRISVDGKLLWAGECRYGKDQQIISVPLDVPGAKSIVVEYLVTEQGGFYSYNMPSLYFTRAEFLDE